MSSKRVKVGWIVTSVIDIISLVVGGILKSVKDCDSPDLKTGLADWLIYTAFFNLFITWFVVVWRQVLQEKSRFIWSFVWGVVFGPAIRILLIILGIVILSTLTPGCNKIIVYMSFVEIVALFLTIPGGLIDAVESRKRHLTIVPFLIFNP